VPLLLPASVSSPPMSRARRWQKPPGLEQPHRFRPRFHWELLVCGVSGHELLGTDARTLRPEDAVFARDAGPFRWHRCLRCDSWLPLPVPEEPTREVPPDPHEVEVPLRGRALRDKVVLRVIAIDRALHFLVLAGLAIVLFVFAGHVRHLRRVFNRIVADYGGGVRIGTHGLLHDVERLVTLQSNTLRLVALVAAAYALLEGLEAVGLWLMKRWAEYLTFVATIALLPLEIFELTKTVSPFKIVALVVNLAIAVYLLFAKRLFGLRGGARAEREDRARDAGWDALVRTEPPSTDAYVQVGATSAKRPLP
jgi:uncharacterized membrane protein (DUF2068 family)